MHSLKDKINKRHPTSVGQQSALSRKFGEYIVEALDSLASWIVLFDRCAVCCLIKSYLNAEKRPSGILQITFLGVIGSNPL